MSLYADQAWQLSDSYETGNEIEDFKHPSSIAYVLSDIVTGICQDIIFSGSFILPKYPNFVREVKRRGYAKFCISIGIVVGSRC